MGVRGLPMNRRGDRIFGSKENFSFTLSSTDGATYVKPCKGRGGEKQGWPATIPTTESSNEGDCIVTKPKQAMNEPTPSTLQ